MPRSFNGVPSVPRSLPAVRSLIGAWSPYFRYPYAISGVTKDAANAPLPSCDITLYRTADDSVSGKGTSDAAGAYRIDASNALFHYARATKAGAPEVDGVTVNTLVGT